MRKKLNYNKHEMFYVFGVIPTAESEFSNFMIKYSDELETKLENSLVWGSDGLESVF